MFQRLNQYVAFLTQLGKKRYNFEYCFTAMAYLANMKFKPRVCGGKLDCIVTEASFGSFSPKMTFSFMNL